MTDEARSAAAQGQRTTAPYGSWASPITARLIAESGIALGGLQAAAGQLFWVEMRPLEDGRLRARAARPRTATSPTSPAGRPRAHARARVRRRHLRRCTRGATAASPCAFSDFDDQRLYRGGRTWPADAARERGRRRPSRRRRRRPRGLRYADGRVTPDGPHARVRARAPRRRATSSTSSSAAGRRLGRAARRRRRPRLLRGAAPQPRRAALAWLSWDHPQMPWDGTELWVAELTAAGELAAERRVAGGPAESVLQPAWSPDGRLHFVSDRSGWWNLYRVEGERAAQRRGGRAPTPPRHRARPAGRRVRQAARGSSACSNYDFLPTGASRRTTARTGVEHLGAHRPRAPRHRPAALRAHHVLVAGRARRAGRGRSAAALRGPPWSRSSTRERGALREVRRSKTVDVDPGYLSAPEPIEFPTRTRPGSIAGPLADEIAGAAGRPPPHRPRPLLPAGEPRLRGAGGRAAAADRHEPRRPDRRQPRRLLASTSSSGPAAASPCVDVNYGGCTGYGRAYRERLHGQLGRRRRRRLRQRRALPGRSAATSTPTRARHPRRQRRRLHHAARAHLPRRLRRRRQPTSASPTWRRWPRDTHKFESRYLDGLVGPYPERRGRLPRALADPPRRPTSPAR